ncbi:MAG TPA: T9SS type A sorting domain-containing protein [Crocinitomicaceae bacterium]|nr:T9SS type A sorting domain-containing protein [Crocinitomicaceae bacterium]
MWLTNFLFCLLVLLTDVQAINNFIINEVEPWYLGLQNENLGAQARSNYSYKAFRRAKYSIVVGNLVTPKTDPGDYVVEQNADLRLEAGQQIVLKPGVHIKNGATAHLKIAYQECFATSGLQVQNPPQASAEEMNSSDSEQQNLSTNELERETITVFPNPSTESFTIEITNNINLQTLTIYNVSGQLVDKVENITVPRYVYEKQLKQGTYLLVIQMHDNKVVYKKMVIL